MDQYEIYENNLNYLFDMIAESGALALRASSAVSRVGSVAKKASDKGKEIVDNNKVLSKGKEVAGKVTKTGGKAIDFTTDKLKTPSKPVYIVIDGLGDVTSLILSGKVPSIKEIDGIPTAAYAQYQKKREMIKGAFKVATIAAVSVSVDNIGWLTSFDIVVKSALAAMPIGTVLIGGLIKNLKNDEKDTFSSKSYARIMDAKGLVAKAKEAWSIAKEVYECLKEKKITEEEAVEKMKKADIIASSCAKFIDKLKTAAKALRDKYEEFQKKGIEYIAKNTKGVKESTEVFGELVQQYLNATDEDFRYEMVRNIIEEASSGNDFTILECVVNDFVKGNKVFRSLFESVVYAM